MLLAGSGAFYAGLERAVREGRLDAPRQVLSVLAREAEPTPAEPGRTPEPRRLQDPAPPEPGPQPTRLATAPPEPGKAGARVAVAPPGRGKARARAAVVIDDCGQSLDRDRPFLDLEEPLTLAVLPHLPASREVAAEARDRGRCVLLHLPMEGAGGRDPGPGALQAGMGDEELARVARADFEAVPGARGFNNHEGSQGTADARLVGVAVAEARSRGLFVLDSRTTAATLLAGEAARQGVPALSRDVFLDNDDDVDSIRRQLEVLAEVALRRGTAVALGHPRPATLEALRTGLPRLREAGVEVVPLEELVPGQGEGTR